MEKSIPLMTDTIPDVVLLSKNSNVCDCVSAYCRRVSFYRLQHRTRPLYAFNADVLPFTNAEHGSVT
jgi:hypothetical protein